MPLHFTTLASGSAGNAALIDANGYGLLLDVGLGPRELADRLDAVGASWNNVDAVLLTHVHSDHWNDRTFAQLLDRRIPLYCHANHSRRLGAASANFAALRRSKFVRLYRGNEGFDLPIGVRCRPLTLRHDGGATFGFRLECGASLFHGPWAMAYVADLGCWDTHLAQAMANVDLLAIEFNHDRNMELTSGRSRSLIDRVLGDDGHLSNDQAAALLQEVVRRSMPGKLRHVVQLHLSRDCNHPELAAAAAQRILERLGVRASVITAEQDAPGPRVSLGMACAPIEI